LFGHHLVVYGPFGHRKLKEVRWLVSPTLVLKLEM